MEKRLIDALLSPAAYDEPTGSVALLQTHVSLLFLTDRHVYKIKKPVDFGFLNFTTLDRRRFYCEEEVRLNRRLCPDMYLGVVEVRHSSGGIAMGGVGEVLDYAVKMKRLPAGGMLDRLLATAAVDEAAIRRIARRIAAFHRTADRGPEIAANGGIDGIRRTWEDNFQHLANFVGQTIAGDDLLLLRRWVETVLRERGARFAARVADGYIRDCDGDIHSENICLADDLYIFDCIEFNARYRHIDTAADIAFLLMDLEFRGRRDLATALFDEYQSATGDTTIGDVLDLYLVYRAVVRGKVESLRLGDPLIGEQDKQLAKEAADRHFRLARGYILRQRLPPGLIVFCGMMGVGKSTLARELAFELGGELLVSDVLRKELAGLAPTERRSSGYHEGIYTPEFTRMTYRELFSRAEAALRSARHVVLDASFGRRADRHAAAQLAARLGVRCTFLQIRCPEPVLRRRLEQRVADPAAISDGRWEFYGIQKHEFEPLTAAEETWSDIDTDVPIAMSLRCILGTLGVLDHDDEKTNPGPV